MTESSNGKHYGDDNSIFSAQTQLDLVKGWNEKRQSSNEVISGLTPFVQLIGIFNINEYTKMLSDSVDAYKRKVYYVENDVATEVSLETLDSEGNVRDLYTEMESKLQNRYFNLYTVNPEIQDELVTLTMTPQNGIMMAQTISQSKNPKGGVGITDLQIDYGKQGVLGARTYTIRLTVNDPSIINERPEYSKLATQFGEFMILYGWSNPTNVPGYDATPPPQLELDPKGGGVTDENGVFRPKEMMVIPTMNMNSGGYWSAAQVSINKYDFSFNDVGQLEITAVLRDMTSIHLTTTKVSTIAPLFKRLFSTSDYDPKARVKGIPNEDFLSFTIKNLDGQSINIKDNIMLEQAMLTTKTEETSNNSFINVVEGGNEQSLNDKLDALEDEGDSWNATHNFSHGRDLLIRQQTESKGFPQALGISTYEPISKLTSVVDPETGVETQEEKKDYKVKTVYYYLGWVLEGIRLCLSDANRSRVAAGNSAFNPKFFYLQNEDTSKITTAFQNHISAQNRNGSMEERIQEALIKLKENCLPPTPPMRDLEVDSTIESGNNPMSFIDSGLIDKSSQYSRPDTGRDKESFMFYNDGGQKLVDFVSRTIEPCMGTVVYEGVQGSQKDLALQHLITSTHGGAGTGWPPNDKIPEGLRRSAMRGTYLSGVGGRDRPDPWSRFHPGTGFFIPDWPAIYDEENPNPNGTLNKIFGSDDGYDPANPTAYKAADKAKATGGFGGQFYYKITYHYRWKVVGGDVKVVKIVEVNDFRLRDPETWNATQLRWHVMYRRYLGVYFEHVIRQRVDELAREGRTIEDVYDEPIDLDFLTSFVYRNHSFSANNRENPPVPIVPEFWSMSDKFQDNIIEQINPHIESLNSKITNLNSEIESIRDRLYGPITGLDGEERNDASSMGNRYKAYLQIIRNIKIAIEGGGGKYKRETDEFGNEILIDYRNYAGVLQGPRTYTVEPTSNPSDRSLKSYITASDSPGGEPQQRTWEIIYGTENERPLFSEEWWFWKKAPGGQGLDNSAGSWFPDFEYRASEDEELVPIERFRYSKSEDRYYVYSGEQSALREQWTSESTGQLITDAFFWKVIGPPLTEDKRLFDSAVAALGNILSSSYAREMEEIRVSMLELIKTIGFMQAEVDELASQVNRYQTYINNMTSEINDTGRDHGISIYDDTSSIDTSIEVKMGRTQNPCILTTIPAQFFKAALDSQYSLNKGVGDVENYGPAAGGTQYYYPSNIRRFVYDPRKRGKPPVGWPKTILDGENIQNTITTGYYLTRVPLDTDIEETDTRSKRPGMWAVINVQGYDLFSGWTGFGVAETPSQGGYNIYGFKPGPRILTVEGTLHVDSTGNYVANYGEFLDLFGVKTDYNLPGGEARIVGEWPTPIDGVHVDEGDNKIPFFYQVDEANNVIMPNSDPDEGGDYIQTGHYLGYGNDPVYLYPDRQHAIRVNISRTPGSDGWIMRRGLDTQAQETWRKPDGEETLNIKNNDIAGYATTNRDNDHHGNRQLWGPMGGNTEMGEDGRGMLYSGRYESTRGDAWVKIDDHYPHAEVPAMTVLGNSLDDGPGIYSWSGRLYDKDGSKIPFGLRIGRNQHNMQLTLDQKRALVIPRGAMYADDLMTLGSELPAVQGEKYESAQKRRQEAIDAGYANATEAEAAGVTLSKAKYNKGRYSNPDYPFGSGLYESPGKVWGSKIDPRKDENYLYIGDFLKLMPGSGFFTRVNNENYSPTTIKPDGTIVEGQTINQGVVDFIIQNVLAPLGRNRRVGTRYTGDGHFHEPRGPIEINDGEKWRITDTTYRHLFSENTELTEEPAGPSFADLSNLTIDSVADIPVRRDIVDNLMTKNNTNMSLAQFIQEVTRPGSLGVNTGSMHVGFRQSSGGVYEVFQASKNWQETARKMNEDYNISILTNRYPDSHLLFDYKANDSLIENIDMNSKFDPAVALSFKRGSLDFTQNSERFVKFLAYGNVAPDLVQFLSEYDRASNTNYADTIKVGTDSAVGWGGRIEIEKNAFTGDNRIIPQNVISQFLMQKPERVAKLNTFLQSQAGGNFTTQLMANYMRQTTITIHGTVNIVPFNTIHVRGVLPDLEGVYLVTNTRDSVTPQGFNTVINAVLIEPINALESDNV